MQNSSENSLRYLPAVDAALRHPGVRAMIDEQGRETVTTWIRDAIVSLRADIQAGKLQGDQEVLLDELVDRLAANSKRAAQSRLGPVINATGIILHTGLGRAPISQAAKTAITQAAAASNVEIDLETTDRHYRGHQLQPAFRTLTGCEDSLLVNNNAAATLLTLQALCAGKEVIISRGQLIEIGGSFRLPDIFELSGVKLREVGTTNRTKLSDYENAIGPETAAIMLVHPSNYRIIGFTTSPGITELTELAHRHQILSIDDIGSGSLVDMTKYGLIEEPRFQDSLNANADVALGSGDKLLGGPQAGIILGTSACVEKIRQHPLARAVRVGKLTLGAMSATLDSYLRGTHEQDIPTLSMLAADPDDLLCRAGSIRDELKDIGSLDLDVHPDTTMVGGGSLPGVELPTAVLSMSHSKIPADELARNLRLGTIRLFCRIHQDRVIIDLRSVSVEDDSRIALAVRLIATAKNS